MKIPREYLSRQAEITALYLEVMNKHLDDFMAGKAEEMAPLKVLAGIMCLHPVHVSNVIKLYTGHHPCYFYERRILEEAKTLLADERLSISHIATRLTYDKSNFTKFFKQYQGTTPSAYREELSISHDLKAVT